MRQTKLLQSPFRIFLLLSLFLLTGYQNVNAQDISLGGASIYDQNIFEISFPTSDQITQFQLDASKDWDMDQLSLNLSYNGSLLLFRDLTSRNYHLHLLSLNSVYHFTESEKKENGGDEEPDTTDNESDSSDAMPKSIDRETSAAPIHSDSSDQFLYASLVGASQFNKNDFSQYDNTRIAGTVIFRQPLNEVTNLRPSYALAYHTYPNLSGLTNIENLFSLQLGTSAVYRGWIAATIAYGIKSYPISTTYTYTITPPGQLGRGNFGAGRQRTGKYELNTPSVNQVILSINWQQNFLSNTQFTAAYTYYGNPSTTARILPRQLRSVLEQHGALGTFSSQTTIFDDHYAFSGSDAALQVQQSLPLAIILTIQARYQNKTYTTAAMDLSDTVVIANHREDRKFESEVNLSKTFSLAGGKSLKSMVEFHYLRNNSNAPYYDFNKNAFTIGFEFSF